VNYYNHDTLLLLSVTSSAWACWRAFDRRSLAYWALLGVCLGLGALAKYQVALAAAAVFVWWVARQGWRDRLHRQGLALCAAIALLIFSPHLIWAISHDFPTLRYALRSSLGAPLTLAQCSVGVIEWLGGQLAQFAGALLLGAALWWRGKRSAQQDPDAGTLAPPHPHARAFLLVWGLLPLALMAVIGLLFHAKLQRNWGTAYMPFCCAALMLWIGPRVWLQLRWRQALTGFALAQALLLAFALSAMSASKPTLNQQRWYRFASQEVADTIGPAARSLLGGRIRVIAGPQKLASVLALRLPERPLVLVDGSYEYSPWLPQDMSTMCGILWVGGPKDEAPYDVVRHDIDGGLWWAVEMVANDFSDCA
jgi:4-amino-4-deoxy-L-arabinose transferase-like glycosyltransferase